MFLMVLTGKTQSFEENWIDGWGSWSIVVQSGMACEEKVKSQSVGSQALNAWPMTHGTAWTFATYFTAQRSMPDFLRGVRGNMMENDGKWWKRSHKVGRDAKGVHSQEKLGLISWISWTNVVPRWCPLWRPDLVGDMSVPKMQIGGYWNP